MFELAQQHSALVVALEHRFYGESSPTADMTVSNLQYLTSEQALGDLARFRNYLAGVPGGAAAAPDTHSTPPLRLKHSGGGSQWVAFGGSYPGALSAWVKTKFPSLFVGTVASSAPVQPENDFVQYAQVVGAALGNAAIGGSAECVAEVAAGVNAVAAASAAGQEAALPEALRPCSAINSVKDRSAYFGELFGNFQGTVQYNLEQNNTHVKEVCAAVTSNGGGVAGFAAVTALFSNRSAPFADRCVQSNWTADVVAPLTNITFDGESSMRPVEITILPPQPPLATENLLENTDGVLRPPSPPSMFSWGGTLLPSLYADACYVDAVVVFKGSGSGRAALSSGSSKPPPAQGTRLSGLPLRSGWT